MNKIKTAVILAIAAFGLALGTQAQTNSTGGTTIPATNAPPGWYAPLLGIYQDLTTASNIAIAPFGVTLTSGDKAGTWGGGVLALYNVNNYVGIGIGTYWLSQWYEFNGSVQLQYPLALWSSVVVTPFVVAGIGTSFAGAGNANGDVEVVSQLGLDVDVVNIGKGWTLGGGGFFGNIAGANAYSGNDAGFFMNVKRGF